jgi:hypothetical protein
MPTEFMAIVCMVCERRGSYDLPNNCNSVLEALLISTGTQCICNSGFCTPSLQPFKLYSPFRVLGFLLTGYRIVARSSLLVKMKITMATIDLVVYYLLLVCEEYYVLFKKKKVSMRTDNVVA